MLRHPPWMNRRFSCTAKDSLNSLHAACRNRRQPLPMLRKNLVLVQNNRRRRWRWRWRIRILGEFPYVEAAAQFRCLSLWRIGPMRLALMRRVAAKSLSFAPHSLLDSIRSCLTPFMGANLARFGNVLSSRWDDGRRMPRSIVDDLCPILKGLRSPRKPLRIMFRIASRHCCCRCRLRPLNGICQFSFRARYSFNPLRILPAHFVDPGQSRRRCRTVNHPLIQLAACVHLRDVHPVESVLLFRAKDHSLKTTLCGLNLRFARRKELRIRIRVAEQAAALGRLESASWRCTGDRDINVWRSGWNFVCTAELTKPFNEVPARIRRWRRRLRLRRANERSRLRERSLFARSVVWAWLIVLERALFASMKIEIINLRINASDLRRLRPVLRFLELHWRAIGVVRLRFVFLLRNHQPKILILDSHTFKVEAALTFLFRLLFFFLRIPFTVFVVRHIDLPFCNLTGFARINRVEIRPAGRFSAHRPSQANQCPSLLVRLVDSQSLISFVQPHQQGAAMLFVCHV